MSGKLQRWQVVDLTHLLDFDFGGIEHYLLVIMIVVIIMVFMFAAAPLLLFEFSLLLLLFFLGGRLPKPQQVPLPLWKGSLRLDLHGPAYLN